MPNWDIGQMKFYHRENMITKLKTKDPDRSHYKQDSNVDFYHDYK